MSTPSHRLLPGRLAAWLVMGLWIQLVPAQNQVTTRTDAVGTLLNQWFAEGSAAGNKGDFYDNRDGLHSPLNLSRYPQLQSVPYTQEELKSRRNHGAASFIHPFPTLGNASLASSATQAGSLPRIVYHIPNGIPFLQSSYLANNLYVYPEHQDHDPEWGDLYPLNSPFVVISQGSSGSDLPFVEAFAATLAAFPPDLKKELIESRLLVPTLQYIFRRSYQPVLTRKDYLSGKAHPAVFQGEWIDQERMIQRAHRLTRETIPPLVQLQVLSESTAPRNGIEMFETEAQTSERLADQPSVIARIFRSRIRKRTLRVSAARTVDVLKRPVRIEWRLLRGDPELVTIKAHPSGAEAEITVHHHPNPLPVPGQPDIRSFRIDIGAFADNGASLSAPAFVSFYMLPNELRSYDEQGRLRQIDYQAPSRRTGLPSDESFRWGFLLERIWKGGHSDWGGSLIWDCLSEAEQTGIRALRAKLAPILQSHRNLEAQLHEQETALAEQRQRSQELTQQARDSNDSDLLAAAKRQEQELQLVERAGRFLRSQTESQQVSLQQRWRQNLQSASVTGRPLLDVLKESLQRLLDDPTLYARNRMMIEERLRSSASTEARQRIQKARQHLLDRRILLPDSNAPDRIVSFTPLAAEENRFYRHALNRTLLAEVFLPDVVDFRFGPEWSDPRLTSPKPWRDICIYSEDSGDLVGWKRIQDGKVRQYDASGRFLGPDGPEEVEYRLDPKSRILVEQRPGN